MSALESIKELLGNPEGVDTKLNTIINLTQNRLLLLLGIKEVPAELEYIVTEVSIMRFNRVGSEGVKTHSVEGESMAFNNDDFDTYAKDIKAWLNAQNESKKGRVHFL